MSQLQILSVHLWESKGLRTGWSVDCSLCFNIVGICSTQLLACVLLVQGNYMMQESKKYKWKRNIQFPDSIASNNFDKCWTWKNWWKVSHLILSLNNITVSSSCFAWFSVYVSHIHEGNSFILIKSENTTCDRKCHSKNYNAVILNDHFVQYLYCQCSEQCIYSCISFEIPAYSNKYNIFIKLATGQPCPGKIYCWFKGQLYWYLNLLIVHIGPRPPDHRPIHQWSF